MKTETELHNLRYDAYHAENRIDYILAFVWARPLARIRFHNGLATGWTDSTVCYEVSE